MPLTLRRLQHGEYVQLRYWNGQAQPPCGRIYSSHSRSPFSDLALEQLGSTYGPEPLRFINQRWYSVILNNDGPVARVPQDLLEVVEPFLFRHYESYYYFTGE